MAYSPKGSWRQLKNDASLAVSFLKYFNVTTITEEVLSNDGDPHSLLQDMPEVKDIDATLREINEMANEEGKERFIEFSIQLQIPLPYYFQEAKSDLARSLCVFV